MAASTPYIASQLQASASHIFSDFGTGPTRYIVKLSAPYRHDKRLRWGVEGQGASWSEALDRMLADGHYSLPPEAVKAAQKAVKAAKAKAPKSEYEPDEFDRLVASGDIRVTSYGNENTYGTRDGYEVFSKNYPKHNPKHNRKNPTAGKWVPYTPADAAAWTADRSPDKKGSYRLMGTGSALVCVSPIKLHQTSPTVSYLPGVYINGRWLNMERAYSTVAKAKKVAEEQYTTQARYEGHKANPYRVELHSRRPGSAVSAGYGETVGTREEAEAILARERARRQAQGRNIERAEVLEVDIHGRPKKNPRKQPVRYTLVMEGFGPVGEETAAYNMGGRGYFTKNLAEYAGHLYTWNAAGNRIGSSIGHAGVSPATAAAYAKKAEAETNATLKAAGHSADYVKVHVNRVNPNKKRARKSPRKH